MPRCSRAHLVDAALPLMSALAGGTHIRTRQGVPVPDVPICVVSEDGRYRENRVFCARAAVGMLTRSNVKTPLCPPTVFALVLIGKG